MSDIFPDDIPVLPPVVVPDIIPSRKKIEESQGAPSLITLHEIFEAAKPVLEQFMKKKDAFDLKVDVVLFYEFEDSLYKCKLKSSTFEGRKVLVIHLHNGLKPFKRKKGSENNVPLNPNDFEDEVNWSLNVLKKNSIVKSWYNVDDKRTYVMTCNDEKCINIVFRPKFAYNDD